MDRLFISDLHLSEERPHITAAFLAFLDGEARQAGQLYLLGDLFDAWIGDDDDRPLAETVAVALARLSAAGVAVFFQHGNRDFLLGERYAHRCGMMLLPELALIKLGETSCLLAHGDQFCTRDQAYQAFRAQVRDPAWQAAFLARSLQERKAIAADLRARSREANSLKAQDIMDVTPAVVLDHMQQQGASLLIHGHTHRPARHALQLPAGLGERCVLGDWDTHYWQACWSPATGLQLDRRTI